MTAVWTSEVSPHFPTSLPRSRRGPRAHVARMHVEGGPWVNHQNSLRAEFLWVLTAFYKTRVSLMCRGAPDMNTHSYPKHRCPGPLAISSCFCHPAVSNRNQPPSPCPCFLCSLLCLRHRTTGDRRHVSPRLPVTPAGHLQNVSKGYRCVLGPW